MGFQCHCQWVLIVHILCTRVQCARAIEDVSALWHLWRRAAAGAERRSAVVVYWKKEEQEETAMANAIYEKLQGSVIRRATADGLAARYDKWAPILYLTVQAIKGISPRNVLDGYTYSLVLPPPRCLELHRRRRRPPVSRLRTSTSGVGTRE